MNLVILFLLLTTFWTLSLSTVTEEFLIGHQLFTADVYKKLKSQHGNILVSPVSAEIVLALTQSGAKDETAEEIRRSLHLPNDDEKTKSAIKKLLTDIQKSEDYTIKTANKIYLSKNIPIKDHFRQIAVETYKSDLENIDFSKKSQAAATINKWVEDQTQNKIHNLVDPKLLGSNIPMLLVNALYFRGRWRKEFRKSATKKIDFYKTPTEVIQVDALHQEQTHSYHENAELDAKFLEMDFSYDATMGIVLPNKKSGITSLENHIEEVLKTRPRGFEKVNVVLPKFKIESKTDFKEILKQLGMVKAFSLDGSADFSPMAGKKGDISIAEVIQKAFIEVDENGVEAAAATFVLPAAGAAPAPPRIPKDFIVDHPFIFYIKVQDVIIFVGRVSEPTI